MALAAGGCSERAAGDISASRELYLEFNASRLQLDITKATITADGDHLDIKWSSGDKLYVVGESEGYLGYVSLKAGAGTSSGTFCGNISLSEEQVLHLYSFGSEVDPQMVHGCTSYNYSVADQDGTMASIQKNMHLMHGATAAISPEQGSTPIAVSMSNMFPIALFNLTSQSGFTAGTDITCTNAPSSAVLNLKTGTFSSFSTENPITLHNTSTTASAYYMALLPGTDVITFTQGSRSFYFNPSSALTASSFYSGDEDPIPVKKQILLPGLFTVGAGADGVFGTSDDSKVQFTKGNLWVHVSVGIYDVEDRQIDYPTSYNISHVGHFYWTNTVGEAAGSSASPGSPYLFCDGGDESRTITIAGQSGFFALSSDEWTNLVNRDNKSGPRYNKSKQSVTVEGVANCLILAPDDFSGTLADTYTLTQCNQLSLLCLPPSGIRSGLSISSQGERVSLWTSSPHNGVYAYAVSNGSIIYTSSPYSKSKEAVAIRLVKRVQN